MQTGRCMEADAAGHSAAGQHVLPVQPDTAACRIDLDEVGIQVTRQLSKDRLWLLRSAPLLARRGGSAWAGCRRERRLPRLLPGRQGLRVRLLRLHGPGA